jgi:hypothetical protein
MNIRKAMTQQPPLKPAYASTPILWISKIREDTVGEFSSKEGMDLSLERWKDVIGKEQEAIARSLAKQLPSGFRFDSIQEYQLGDQQNRVALFQKENTRFALIPGGVISVGYDSERPWQPNPDELEDWQETAEEHQIDRTIQEHIADVTLRVREVELAPFLIETKTFELGWEPLEIDDPEVQEILREHPTHSHVEVSYGDSSVRVRRKDDGSIIAECSLDCTHAELAADLAISHFRFPTSDEWEFACGNGAKTLFRWGDHVPCDHYPTDITPWRSERKPLEVFGSDWNAHRQPNAFGLLIASNPYHYELTAEIGTTRGGDGGGMLCGGAGFFVGWLTLATAYFEEHACKHDPLEPIPQGYTFGRRVLDLR